MKQIKGKFYSDVIECVNDENDSVIISGSRNFGERGGARNMKYKPPHSVAILFCLLLLGRGPWPPLPPLSGSATGNP